MSHGLGPGTSLDRLSRFARSGVDRITTPVHTSRPSHYIGKAPIRLFTATIAIVPMVLAPTAAPVHADDAGMTVSTKRLKLESALRIAQATIEQCRREGVQIAATVVDRGGHAQVMLRDVLAMDITVPISQQKAHTAMAFNTPLSELQGRFTSPFQVPKMDGLIVGAGGIPINVAGAIMGGIGVSGAPSGETDEKCAWAGLEAVRADLEMEGM